MEEQRSERDGGRDADTNSYERDFWFWTNAQARLLRAGRLAEADIANIAEELETLGRREVAEARSRFRILALHLLKERYQPERASRSWASTIVVQRQDLAKHLLDNPSLKPRLPAIYAEAYADARALAIIETGLPPASFPIEPPFTVGEALDPDVWPGRRRDERS